MSKSNVKAVKLLEKGHDFFKNFQCCEALLSYNQSLCLAEPGTNTLALCYGRRSAVYFHLKEYELCIANIELARNHGYPADLIAKLDDRELECNKLMKTQHPERDNDPMNFFKLSCPANVKLPCLADCLRLKVNKKYGRHIITTQDLKVGDIVAVTELSFVFFDKRARLHHCSNCGTSSMKLSLIPCVGCAKAMYCSHECMTKDKKKFHQFECGIDDNPEDQHLDYNPLKILVQMLALFDGNVDEMKKFLLANKKAKCVFDFDMSNKCDPMFEKNMLLATLSMTNDMNCAEMGKSHCLQTHHRFIMKHPKLRTMWMSPDKKFLDKLLLKFLDVEDVKGNVNCFTEIEMNLKENGYDLIDSKTDTPGKISTFFINRVADVIDPYLSLLNQSCFPNIITKFVDNKYAWIVARPIKAGEQLFMFRGPGTKYVTPRIIRQQMMREYFGYQCDCEGCRYDWPTQDKMKKIADLLPCEKRLSALLQTMNLQSQDNLNQPKQYVEYAEYATKIQAMSEYYPCWDNVFYESRWMLNIYRLATPAKWLNS